MHKKKNLIIIIISVLILAGIGTFFALQNTINEGTGKKPAPVVSQKPSFEEHQEAAWSKLQKDKKYEETVSNYSQYFSPEESNYDNSYETQNVIPGIYAVSKYVEEGYFNPYFVSNYWGTKDDYSANSVDSFVGKYLTDSYKETLMSTPRENLDNKLFIPDAQMSIPVGCAEDWTDYECFALPSEIKKITVKGLDINTAVFTVQFEMNLNYQSSDMALGSYITQTRNYSVDFTVENTNPHLKNLKFADIKINNITASLDITNNDNTTGE